MKKTKGKPDDIDLRVGKNLRFIRQSIGMSQEELSKKLDLTFQQIQKYERGFNRISASKLYHLAEILNINVATFYEETPELAVPQDQVDEDIYADFNKLLKIYSSLHSDRDKKILLDLAKTLKKNA